MGFDTLITQIKENPPITISEVALTEWQSMLDSFFDCNPDIKRIVIPMAAYTPGKDSDEGMRMYLEPINVLYIASNAFKDKVKEAIECAKVNPMLTDAHFALNRNVMIIGDSSPPEMFTFDIIDVDNLITKEELEECRENYVILKTNNSYHLYPKNVMIEANIGQNVRDGLWYMEYIRITEGGVKGEITKYE